MQIKYGIIYSLINPCFSSSLWKPVKENMESCKSAKKQKLLKSIILWIDTPRVKSSLLFFIIFTVGLIARLWDFGRFPSGLNPDEASIGVEAYYLYKYGVDRYGTPYPVHLISWGSGQNSLYAYLILPLVALKGLGPISIRLPMLISGILSLPLTYFAGKKILGEKFGLLAMFFMAISPWHIVNTRWAVESNILPFLVLAGFTLLLYSSPKNTFFIIACVFFSLCFYAYGTAYVGVPIFLVLAIPVLLRTKHVTIGQAAIGLAVLFVLAFPIGLFVIVNTFHLSTIYLGPITIPRLPVQARYEVMTAGYGRAPLQAILENIRIMLKMLWLQEDAFPWNYVHPFGYFYKVTFPFIMIGGFLAIPRRVYPEKNVERWLLIAWVIAAVAIGVAHPTNMTRLNFIFTPVLFFMAIFVLEFEKYYKYSLTITVFALSIGFVAFTMAYHGEDYRRKSDTVFNVGIIPSVVFATENSKSSICFSESSYAYYIYVLFTQKMYPSEYMNGAEWLYPDYTNNPTDPARTPRQIERYHFRLADCSQDQDAAYILLLKESPPNGDVKYKIKRFDKFVVYIPKE